MRSYPNRFRPLRFILQARRPPHRRHPFSIGEEEGNRKREKRAIFRNIEKWKKCMLEMKDLGLTPLYMLPFKPVRFTWNRPRVWTEPGPLCKPTAPLSFFFYRPNPFATILHPPDYYLHPPPFASFYFISCILNSPAFFIVSSLKFIGLGCIFIIHLSFNL